MNTHRARSLQLSTAWIIAIGANLWNVGLTPRSIFAGTQPEPRQQQFFPTTDPRGYLTLVTLNGADGSSDEPDAWQSNTASKSIHTSRPNTAVSFTAKLPGRPTDWRLGVTGGSNSGPAPGAYPVMVSVNDLPTGLITLDASGGLDTQWTSIGQLAGQVRITLTWGEGTGQLASVEPFNLTSVQLARPFRDPEEGPLTGDTTDAASDAHAFPAAGQPGASGSASPSGGGGGGSPPLDFPAPTDPRIDPDLTPPNPHDRRSDPPYVPPDPPGGDPGPTPDPPTSSPPPTIPPTPPGGGPPPFTPPPPGDPPPVPPPITDPPEIPSPGAVFPLTIGALAILHRRRRCGDDRA